MSMMKPPTALYLEAEVPGWVDDDVRVAALFKAFSGQREDWQARLDFWKALIVKVARHLGLVVVDAKEVQQQWFMRGGLLPLCLNDVLLEMLRSGELQSMEQLFAPQPAMARRAFLSIGRALAWAGQNLFGLQTVADKPITGKLIVSILCKERVSELVKVLNDASWKSECLLTMQCFAKLCGTPDASQAVLHHLLVNKQGSYLCIDGEERIEGVKLSLLQSSVSPVSEADYNMLQLYWTSEKMQQRFDTLDRQVTSLRESTIRSIKAGDKQRAKRYLVSMKALASSRDKCADFTQKIQSILDAIADAEATKKVSEAIEIGNRAMREYHVTLDEVQVQLKELDEAITQQRDIADAMAGTSDAADEEEYEDEYALLEAEIQQTVADQEGKAEKVPPTATQEAKQAAEASASSPPKVEELDELEKHFSKMAVAS